MVVFGEKLLYSGKLVGLGPSICIRSKLVVFRHKLLYSGKSGCSWVIIVLFVKKWLCSGKVVVFRQKWLCSGKSGCIWEKVVVFW